MERAADMTRTGDAWRRYIALAAMDTGRPANINYANIGANNAAPGGGYPRTRMPASSLRRYPPVGD